MIPRRTIAALGASQLIGWGITYYLVAPLGPFIAADLGWSAGLVHGGFSAALVAMGLSSPAVGRWIDRRGGRPVMTAGSLLTALGCAALSLAREPILYYAAWLCLGVAMRMTLYDAAFASLARLGGASARRPIAQITLLGGLASTVFWPVTHGVASALGWRAAVLFDGAFALVTALLHRSIPAGRYPADGAAVAVDAAPSPPAGRGALVASLYAALVALSTFLNSGMSAHMIGILQGLGVAASAAVLLGTLRGVGQSAARLGEILFGRRLHPLALGILASAILPICFAAGLLAGRAPAAGAAYALLFGAGNGLLTIVRGTAPLVLFDPRSYGAVVGRLLVPSFFLSALAPLFYALVIEWRGAATALVVSLGIGAVTLVLALLLRLAPGGRAERSG